RIGHGGLDDFEIGGLRHTDRAALQADFPRLVVGHEFSSVFKGLGIANRVKLGSIGARNKPQHFMSRFRCAPVALSLWLDRGISCCTPSRVRLQAPKQKRFVPLLSAPVRSAAI